LSGTLDAVKLAEQLAERGPDLPSPLRDFTYSVYSHLIPGQDDAVKAADDLPITSKDSVH